ncbi:MAG: argininosuccinate lyase, partial [Alphaproteobacteria bacterium]|nr:argininosuccinate lyase [Alphaproteobacteria bacterium]
TGMVTDFTANPARMRESAMSGYSTATDLADWLVRSLNMPFREAHHVTGKVVKIAEAQSCRLDELPLEAMQEIHPQITAEVFDVLSVEASVASRKSFGGTAPELVKQAITHFRNEVL